MDGDDYMAKRNGKDGRATKNRKRHASAGFGKAPPALLDYRAAAEFLGVARGTLEHWVRHQVYGVPSVKLGRRLVRFRASSLERFAASLERNRLAAVAPPREGIDARV